MSLKLLMRSLTVRRYDKFRMFYRRSYATTSTVNDLVPGISLFQIKQILKQRHIVTIEGHACIIIDCPICDYEKSKKSKIYINKTTGKEIHKMCISILEYIQLDRENNFSCKTDLFQDSLYVRNAILKENGIYWRNFCY